MAGPQAYSDDIQVSASETRTALSSLLHDERFAVSDRCRSLLRYVTEEMLEGRSERIKAYSIAVDLFGRPSSFDPALDPIVRVEASRLRSALQRYNEQYACDLGIAITLPRGSYVPTVTPAHGLVQPQIDSGENSRVPSDGSTLMTSRGWRFNAITLGLAVALAVVCAIVGLWWTISEPIFSTRPALEITMQADGQVSAQQDAARTGGYPAGIRTTARHRQCEP